MSERTEKGDSRMATRLLWMVFAPFEFAIMIFGGALLYLCCALFIYFDGLRSLFERAASLFVLRFRVARISSVTNEKKTAASLSEAAARDPAGREHLGSWLN